MGRVMTDKSQHFQPAFVICVAVLALTAGGMSLARKRLGFYLDKEPASLKMPLDAIDRTSLLPYKVITEQTIGNTEVLDALGTSDYIQWVLDQCRHNKSQAAKLLGINRVSLYRKLKKSQLRE